MSNQDWKNKKVKVIEMYKDENGMEIPREVEIPVWEEVIGDKYSLTYEKTYNEAQKKFSYSFSLSNDGSKCRIPELREQLLALDAGKEINYDGHWFRKYVKDPRFPKIYKETDEEHKRAYGGNKPQFPKKKKVKELKILPIKFFETEDEARKSDHKYTMASVNEMLASGYEFFGDSTNDAIKAYGEYLLVGLVMREAY